MFDQFAAALRAVSRGENKSGFSPRPGQSRLIDWMLDHVEAVAKLCVRWPGGYGKTIGIALAYMILRQFGRVNRLLVVVANDHASEMDSQARLEQRAQRFDSEVGRLASQGARIIAKANGLEITGKLIGKLAKRINSNLKASIGQGREAWLDEDFDHAGRILHRWGCAIRDRVEGKGVLTWLD